MEAPRRRRQTDASRRPTKPRRGAAPAPIPRPRRPRRFLHRTRGCLGIGTLGLLLVSVTGLSAQAQVSRSRPARAAISSAKTPFQCEKLHTSQARAGCFSQLPGASCAHPLVAEKADDTTRGEHRYFRLGFRGESYEGPPQGVELHYSYAPATSNVAMCPYPIGAVYKDSLLYEDDKTHCQEIHHNGRVEKECHSEYDTHSHPEPIGRSGGSFTFDLKSPRTGYLVVKGYFIHPPWRHKA
jgi:hypothetical protein